MAPSFDCSKDKQNPLNLDYVSMVYKLDLSRSPPACQKRQEGQRTRVILKDFAGTVGAVNNVPQLSIDVSKSFDDIGFPVERALDIVGRGNLPQVR